MPNTWTRDSPHMPPPPSCQWCGAVMPLQSVDCMCDRCVEEMRPAEVRFDDYDD
jgi:hypothetical protein